MAVPTRGRGLSRAVFQQPDLIGQAQRQQQINQRDRALDLKEEQFRAKQRAANQVDAFSLDNGDIASFSELYGNLGSSYNNMVYDFVQENAMALAKQKEIGYGKELNQLNSMLNRGKKLAGLLSGYETSYRGASNKQSTDRQAYSQFPSTINELTKGIQFRPSEDGFEMVTEEGQVLPTGELISALNPTQYYQKAPTLYDFLNSGNSNLNRENINPKSVSHTENWSREPARLLPLVDYFWQSQGFAENEIPENLSQELVYDGKVQVGDRVITIQDVKDNARKLWLKNNAVRQPQDGGGNINIFDYVQDANIMPFTKEKYTDVAVGLGIKMPEKFDLRGISIPIDRQARIEVALETKRGGKEVVEDFQGSVTSVYKNNDGSYTGVIYVPEKNASRIVDLNDNDLGRIRQELRLPTNITLDQLIDNVNPENQTWEWEDVVQPVRSNTQAQPEQEEVVEETGVDYQGVDPQKANALAKELGISIEQLYNEYELESIKAATGE